MGTAGFHRLLIQESPEHTLFGRLCLSLGVAVSQRSFCNLRHRISPLPASGQAVILGFEVGRGTNANVEPLTSWRRPACHEGGDMRTSTKDLVLNPAQPKGGETR